ncbi:hypothetical protein TNCV_272731 [Trichonephila clavipes]|nr:hypothetical protein TNCV_272731 [Trichonephila clavipes]
MGSPMRLQAFIPCEWIWGTSLSVIHERFEIAHREEVMLRPMGQDQLMGDVKMTSLQGHFPEKRFDKITYFHHGNDLEERYFNISRQLILYLRNFMKFLISSFSCDIHIAFRSCSSPSLTRKPRKCKISFGEREMKKSSPVYETWGLRLSPNTKSSITRTHPNSPVKKTRMLRGSSVKFLYHTTPSGFLTDCMLCSDECLCVGGHYVGK